MEWKKTVVFKVDVTDPCACGRVLENSVFVDAGEDCCECPLKASSSDKVIIECLNKSVYVSEKTASPAEQEKCKNVEYSNLYTFTKTLSWENTYFMEAANNGQTFPDGSLTGTAYFIINNTHNISRQITLGEWVNLGFLTQYLSKAYAGTTLEIKYSLYQKNSGEFVDWSYLNITESPYTCSGEEFYKEGVSVKVIQASLNVGIDVPEVVNACESYNVTLTISNVGKVYNVTVYYNDKNLKYIGPATFNGIENESGPINSFEPTRNGNVLSWYLGNLTKGGTIKFKVFVNCSHITKADVWADYQTFCDIRQCPSGCEVRHSSDSDQAYLFTEGDITIQKTADVTYANKRIISWNIYVLNKGNGTAKNVEVVDVLGEDFEYLSSSINGVPANPTVNGNVVTWKVGDMPPKDNKTITLNATFKGCNDVDNFVFARWGCCYTNDACNNCCDECQNVSYHVDVEILESSLVIAVHNVDLIDECGGDANVYAIIKNNGPTYLYNVTIREILPDCLEYAGYQESDPNADSFNYYANNNTLIWYFDEIPPESSININFTVRLKDTCVCVEEIGEIVCRANYTTLCGAYGIEDVVPVKVKMGEPVLSLSKSPSVIIANSSEQVTWQIKIRNTGNYKARNITLVDDLPSNVQFVSADPNPDSINGKYH